MIRFLWAVMIGSFLVAGQVWNFGRQPGAAIMAVPLRYADDIIMTHVAVTSSLIPGSLVVETDRVRRILYLHVIGVNSAQDVDRMRDGVLEWEKRIVRAVGSPAQYRALKDDERKNRELRAAARGGR
ncbi:Na+/H+ antiporter subunit E [Microbacterium sp. NIBRBAC000506063]|uniref:Na+/H+ antiporter subunit E n=1 Tax=Microbacterium sp. NIBRBAC000506063 TaxID=2734618 RepID=UPI0021D42245|nr:Na+/H+ antiporter subunit E [Microbacterium sp. NIBRBAC000506063]